MQEVASQAEGYDAADLRVLVDRAVHAAARRQLSAPLPGFRAPAQTDTASSVAGGSPPGAAGGLAVSAADLAKAREGFQPAAAWGVGQLQVCCNLSCMLSTGTVTRLFHKRRPCLNRHFLQQWGSICQLTSLQFSPAHFFAHSIDLELFYSIALPAVCIWQKASCLFAQNLL